MRKEYRLLEDLRKEKEMLATLVMQPQQQHRPKQMKRQEEHPSQARQQHQPLEMQSEGLQQELPKMKLIIKVKPTAGQSYADIYIAVRIHPSLQEEQEQIEAVRRVSNDTMRLQLYPTVNGEKLAEKIRRIIGDKGTVRFYYKGDKQLGQQQQQQHQPPKVELQPKMQQQSQVLEQPQQPQQQKKQQPQRVQQSRPRQKVNRLPRRNHRRRPGAIEVAPTTGHAYLDVYKEIRLNPTLKDVQKQLGGCRRMANDRLVIKLRKGEDSSNLCRLVQTALGARGTARLITDMSEVIIKDIDMLADEKEVMEAITLALGHSPNSTKVSMWEQRNATKCARVRLPRTEAEQLAEKGLRIGYTQCGVKETQPPVMEVSRCFRCLEKGHISRVCRGIDRSASCIRCGSKEHRASTCAVEIVCIVCGGPHRIGDATCKGKH
uniref:CCHC-type domain-containing protein n=1 Tax=Anopheles funestus TaxID=62324 RepID=A0A182RXD2_ANOFN